MKKLRLLAIAITTAVLFGCTGDTLSGNSEEVFVDIINAGSTRIVFASFNVIPVLRPAESRNELQGEGLSPGETVRFDKSCVLGTTQYLHLRWENGSLRNYEISTPCGTTVSYEFPQ